MLLLSHPPSRGTGGGRSHSYQAPRHNGTTNPLQAHVGDAVASTKPQGLCAASPEDAPRFLLGEIPTWWSTMDQNSTAQAQQAILRGPDLRDQYLVARVLVHRGNVTHSQRMVLHRALQRQADYYALEQAVKILPEDKQDWLQDYLRQRRRRQAVDTSSKFAWGGADGASTSRPSGPARARNADGDPRTNERPLGATGAGPRESNIVVMPLL
jgi:hypothetical protein